MNIGKKYNLIIAVAIGVAVIGLYVFYKKKDTTSTTNKDNIPKRNSDGVKSILFIGDSNTEAPFSYADKIQKKYPNIIVKKIAKHSMKTDWMYNSLLAELNRNQYDVVSILGGSNDIYATGKNNSAKIYLDKMYDLTKSKGVKVVAITPPNKNFYINRTDSKQNELFDLNKWIFNNTKKDYVIDFWDITNNIKYFSKSDGYLHAQSNAHEILANELIKKLNLR